VDAHGTSSSLRLRVLAVALIVLVLAGAFVYGWHVFSQRRDAAAEVAQLFAADFVDADGQPQAMNRWRGRLLVVNFWATWCVPCVEEMPELQHIQDDYAARNVVVLGIGTDDLAKVQAFRRQYALHLPLLAAGFDGIELARELGDDDGVLPYTVVISPEGQLLRQHVGRLSAQQLRSWLDERS
jgi:thiol-disulfide isomerase/thioredoxin